MKSYTEQLYNSDQVKLVLSKIHCPSCVTNLEKNLKKINGIIDVNVNFINSSVLINFDSNLISIDKIKDTINSLGYGIEEEDNQILELNYNINGMHCPSCVTTIETTLKSLNGIKQVNLNYLSKQLVIKYDKRYINPTIIKNTIKDLGYSIEDKSEKNKNLKKYLYITQVSLTGLFLFLSWIAGINNWELKEFIYPFSKLEHLFAILGIFIGWYKILTNAFNTLKTFNLNVDVLVSIAVIGAIFIESYKEANTVIFIVLLGELLEDYTITKTKNAIQSLVEILPKKARIKKGDKQEEIDIVNININDIVVIKPGEQVPVDGELLSKEAIVNEAMITGESTPVIKNQNDIILAGSISDNSYFEVKAKKIGEDTTINKIKQLVEDAQNKKPKIQRIADNFAKHFIPVVFVIAICVGVVTLDINKVVTILVAACPCALVLATPIAVVAGIGKAARSGILIKSGQYIEILGKIDTVLFDKTGTLTEGKLSINEIKSFNNYNSEQVLKLAASLENYSEHHIGYAILNKAKELNIPLIPVNNIKIVKGRGISGIVDNKVSLVGSINFIKENNINIEKEIEEYINKQEKDLNTVILVVQDQTILGLISIKDKIREDSNKVINTLKNIGIKLIAILTGDNKVVAQNVAKQLNISEYSFNLLPQDKVEYISKLQKQNKNVMMVGDGINDAPALSLANIGVAMGKSGTAIAIESADIALLKDDLKKIPEAILLGRKTVNIIKQNIAFAIFYNVIVIISASFGFIHIVHGAVFHQLSSLIVILNAMRLLVYKAKFI